MVSVTLTTIMNHVYAQIHMQYIPWIMKNRYINILRLRQNGCHFAEAIFKCIFLNENVWIPNKISPKFVRKGLINNIPALVQIMIWRRPGAKPLSEAMMVNLSTHIYASLNELNPMGMECRHFDPSRFWSVEISVYWYFSLSMFWSVGVFRFVDMLFVSI